MVNSAKVDFFSLANYHKNAKRMPIDWDYNQKKDDPNDIFLKYTKALARYKESKYIIEIADLGQFKIRARETLVVLRFILMHLTPDYLYYPSKDTPTVSFNLKELVDLCGYSDLDKAVRAFDSAAHSLGLLRLSDSSKKINSKNQPQSLINPRNTKILTLTFFPIIKRQKYTNQITIGLNNCIDWQLVGTYFVQMPKAILNKDVSVRTQCLIQLIFTEGRQKTTDIVKHKKFMITLKNVHSMLFLPFPDKEKQRPKQLIIDPIKKAVDETSLLSQKEQWGMSFSLVNKDGEPLVNCNATNFIDNGYLQVIVNENCLLYQDAVTLMKNANKNIVKMKKRSTKKTSAEPADKKI